MLGMKVSLKPTTRGRTPLFSIYSEAAIDAAMHQVRIKELGIPQESRDAFCMLEEAGLLTAELSAHMQAMVGFRNVAVHDYQKLNLAIVRAILGKRLDDFRQFAKVMVSI